MHIQNLLSKINEATAELTDAAQPYQPLGRQDGRKPTRQEIRELFRAANHVLYLITDVHRELCKQGDTGNFCEHCGKQECPFADSGFCVA